MFEDEEEFEEVPYIKGMVVKAYKRGDKLKLPLTDYALINFDENIVLGGFYYETNFKWIGIASHQLIRNKQNGYGDLTTTSVVVLPSPELTQKVRKYREGTILWIELMQDKEGDFVVKKPYNFTTLR